MRYLFHLAYKGTHYKGWQRQADQVSIQQTIEETLSRVLGQPLIIHGCGRTDAGVHASQYFFHANIEFGKQSNFLFVINKNLPGDIVFLDYFEVEDNFNAQKDALNRTYRYFCHLSPDPMLNEISTFTEKRPDTNLIEKAIKQINGTHDFRAFTLRPDKHKSTICHLGSCRFVMSPNGNQFCFEFTGNHFLRAMIRLLVDELMNIGHGKRTISQMAERLEKGVVNTLHARPACPQGLYLSSVQYSDFNISRMTSEPFVL